RIVSGEATPAVTARKPKPKKKLIAGPMLAMVAAAMSTMPSVPPRRRCSLAERSVVMVSDTAGSSEAEGSEFVPGKIVQGDQIYKGVPAAGLLPGCRPTAAGLRTAGRAHRGE